MPIGTISPSPKFVGLDDDGSPLVGGKLYTYVAGTSTPITTYTDAALAVPNANPIILDAAGRATIFLTAATLKFTLRRADDSLVWTQDNVAATSIGQSGGLGEIFTFGGDPNSPVTVNAYPAGAAYSALHAGTSIHNVDSANLVGTFAIEAMIMSPNGVQVSVAIVNLDDGSPDTPLATITSSSVTGARAISGAITFAAAGAAKNYGIKTKLASVDNAYVWGVRLVRTA